MGFSSSKASSPSPGTQEKGQSKKAKQKTLVLYNDDFNTFDHVIKALVEICGHDSYQAEQCTMIVHYKGQCTVKEGDQEELEGMCKGLVERSLTAEIK